MSDIKKGTIGVTTTDIFPVIKKFLYSDHEIFLREIVANAIDATQKMRTLIKAGAAQGETGQMRVVVKVDKDAKTITVSDQGIGMTQEEIEKYINQIAFSGATEFLDKYKDNANAIIGHFGLGFYSSFMVSERVEIFTKSYTGATAQHWSCDGSPDYTLEPCDKQTQGTDIVMHIDEDNIEFADEQRVLELLGKYCKFMAVPVVCGFEKEWKDGKQVETTNEHIINSVEPLWTRRPADLKDEDYATFYRALYPYSEDPLFHIHLNVDYPFNLTGILYFPHIKNNIELQRNKIQLYCNQVFVTDSVEGVVPDFLTLLHGVIDSPDIPLNVSRSYLQSDKNVKKISAHITKKVADRLAEIFKTDRKTFEEKWDALKIFIVYGMLSEEKFYEKAKEFALIKTTDGKFYTFAEYETLIKDNQTDKNGNLIYLYANNVDDQHAYINAAKAKGYEVMLMDGQLDAHWISQMEQKNEKSRFVRVDADVIEKLIEKEETKTLTLTAEQQNALTTMFDSQVDRVDKIEYLFKVEERGADLEPVTVTQNEFSRRMKEMSATGGNSMMMFYGDMPDTYNIVLNASHPLIADLLKQSEEALNATIQPVCQKIASLEQLRATQKEAQDKATDDAEKDTMRQQVSDTDKQIGELREQKKKQYSEFAAKQPRIKQLIDLALLSTGMLKGKALTDFVTRSFQLMK
ncbi:MAG: molecular chaperone HtpG [Bacteroidales bacterium]|nr:molecular chaperone HtpG [Bacteroidales bacterium]